jgi:hypothetical protein
LLKEAKMSVRLLTLKLNIANIEAIRNFSQKVVDIQNRDLISSLQICKTGPVLELIVGVTVPKNDGWLPGLALVKSEIEQKHFLEIEEIIETDVLEDLPL